MIVDVETLISMSEFRGLSEAELKQKLKAIELAIRAYTNNNFQNRCVRFVAKTYSDKVYGTSPFMRVGDTIQISKSGVKSPVNSITFFFKNRTFSFQSLTLSLDKDFKGAI